LIFLEFCLHQIWFSPLDTLPSYAQPMEKTTFEQDMHIVQLLCIFPIHSFDLHIF
jgi:hypothetical protein